MIVTALCISMRHIYCSYVCNGQLKMFGTDVTDSIRIRPGHGGLPHRCVLRSCVYRLSLHSPCYVNYVSSDVRVLVHSVKGPCAFYRVLGQQHIILTVN